MYDDKILFIIMFYMKCNFNIPIEKTATI